MPTNKLINYAILLALLLCAGTLDIQWQARFLLAYAAVVVWTVDRAIAVWLIDRRTMADIEPVSCI